MNIHMQECPENLHTCPFLPFGCYYRGSATDIAKHENDKIHLKLMLYELLKLKNEQSNTCNRTTLKDNTVQQIESNFNMKTVQDDLLKQIENQKLEIDWCKKRIFELEHQYDLEQNKNSYIQTEVFKKLQDQAAEYKITNDGFTELKQQLATTNKSIDTDKVLNDKCEKLNKKLENMEISLVKERKIINEQLGNLKTSFAENKKILSDEIGGVAESLNTLEHEHVKQLGTLKEMIIQQGEKKPAFRSNSFQFIYKIDNFNTSDCVRSDPFYSDKFGYKMLLRVYCKGFLAGTHLSVFLCVMKGENDEKLDWPIRFTAELSLLDQSNHTKHHSHIINTQNIGDKTPFLKPLTQENRGCGFPTFISLDELKRNYLVNNTIVLKANVTLIDE